MSVVGDAPAVFCIHTSLDAGSVVRDLAGLAPQIELSLVNVAYIAFSSVNFFAALLPVVDKASWAIRTFRGILRPVTCAFGVAAVAIWQVTWVLLFFARVLCCAFALEVSVVGISSRAIFTLEGSDRVGAFAFAVAATVIFQTLVHVCGSGRSRRGRSRRNRSRRRHFRGFFITNLLPIVDRVLYAHMTAETVVVESRAFAIRVTRARQKTLFESENVARRLGNKLVAC